MNEYEHLNVQNVCRACLNEENEMKNMMLEEENKEIGLLEMFIAIVSTGVHTSSNTSCNLCSTCEEKLTLSYNFQQQCRKSNQILESCAKNRVNDTFCTQKGEESESEDAYEILNESNDCSVKIIPIKSEHVNNVNEFKAEVVDETFTTVQEETYSDSEHIQKEVVTECTNQGLIRKPRLKQFPTKIVNEAIEASRAYFYKNVECIKCGFVTTNARALSVHMSLLHKEIKEVWCMQCNKEFDNLTEHEEIHKELKCQFCDKSFNSRGHFLEHLRGHSVVRPFLCNVCNRTFVSKRHLSIHFRIHTNEAPYKCKFCSTSFKQLSWLRSHHRKHHNDVQLWQPHNFCSVCNKNVSSLHSHNKQVHGQNLPQESVDTNLNKQLCTICGKQFNNKEKYRIHMRVHTGVTPYKCSFCNKRLNSRNHLVVHERTHTGEKPHVCHVCGKGFGQSSGLNTHLKIHTGRPEICQICQQRFCRPTELKLHMRKHTGEKPFLCTECGQAFAQRSHLVEHNKIHSNIRAYQCTYCDKAFKQSSSLKSHINIHLGHKPFKCSQCSYSCRQSYSLTQHMKTHTNDVPQPDQPHACSFCCKTFSTEAVLTSHMRKTHGIVFS